MSDEFNKNEQQIPQGVDFTEMQLSAVAEIENISMGSAATAVSNLLNAKVWITTPQIRIAQLKDIEFQALEPSIQVVINYIKGVHGSNTMILKQTDVQMMLNQLMGMPLVVTDDFVFDEMNISAVCEVMNQMMGSAATALSEFLDLPIDISTPVAKVKEGNDDPLLEGFKPEDFVVAIQFNLTIDNVINSEFISVIGIDLARTLASSMLKGLEGVPETEKPAAAPSPAPAPQPIPQPAPQPTPPPVQQQYYQQPVYQQQVYQQPPIDVQNVKLHQFESFDSPTLPAEQADNLQLLMGVPLDVSVEIGSARKKVKEILEFSQGTIIELDRQAGAPVDVIVNGHLIARGDVVVIDDNFAVRVTEIVRSRFLDTLGDKE